MYLDFILECIISNHNGVELIKSLDLVKIINSYRESEGRSSIDHDNLIEEIRGYNKIALATYEETIPTSYYDDDNKEQMYFILLVTQAKMFMAKASYTIQIQLEKERDALEVERDIIRDSPYGYKSEFF